MDCNCERKCIYVSHNANKCEEYAPEYYIPQIVTVLPRRALKHQRVCWIQRWAREQENGPGDDFGGEKQLHDINMSTRIPENWEDTSQFETGPL